MWSWSNWRASAPISNQSKAYLRLVRPHSCYPWRSSRFIRREMRSWGWTGKENYQVPTPLKGGSATDRRFEKRSQLFIRLHNETLSVVAVRICNKDCLPVGIDRWDTAPTPTALLALARRWRRRTIHIRGWPASRFFRNGRSLLLTRSGKRHRNEDT